MDVLKRSTTGYDLKHLEYVLAITLGVVLGAVAAVKIADHFNPTTLVPTPSSQELLNILRTSLDAGGSGSHGVDAGFHGGFIDQHKIHFIADRLANHKQSISVSYTSTQDLMPVMPDADLGIGDGTGSSIGNGDQDFGLPEPASLASITMPTFPEPTFPNRPQAITKRKADQAAYVGFRSYPRAPWKAGNAKGEVKLQFTIDEKGSIRDMQVLHEEPLKLGFAQALKDAIYNTTVERAIVNGQPVSCEVTVSYKFGYGTNEKPIVETKGNITASMPH